MTLGIMVLQASVPGEISDASGVVAVTGQGYLTGDATAKLFNVSTSAAADGGPRSL